MVKEIVRLMELILFGYKPEFWQIFGVDVIALFGPMEGPGPKSYAIFEGNVGYMKPTIVVG